MASVRAQYENTPQWMKAPNGKKSNLTRRQWIQTRTQAFKNWFGDWETAQLFNLADTALKDKQYKSAFRFSPSYELADEMKRILGHGVNVFEISADSVRHIDKRHGINNEKEDSQIPVTPEDIACLPYILNNFDIAVRDASHDKYGNKSVKIIKRINGFAVVATIEQGADGVGIVTGWHKKSAASMKPLLTSPRPNARSATDINIVKQEIAEIKNNVRNVSKVVDENGEPLVVYHGTATDGIEIFDHKTAQDKTGRALGFGWGKGKFYFADNEIGAQGAADGAMARGQGKSPQVMRVFLDVKKPIAISEYYRRFKEISGGRDVSGGAPYDENYTQAKRDKLIAKLDKQLQKEGFDGIVDDGSGAVAVYSPNQIKSATANTGAFSRENDSILFQADVWHGSPYWFEKFLMSKIGTGEGAQAFGHGLYFTSEEDIARWYADKLTNPTPSLNGKEITDRNSPEYQIWQRLYSKHRNDDGTISENGYAEEIRETEDALNSALEMGMRSATPVEVEQWNELAETCKKMLAVLRSHKASDWGTPGNRNLYKVTLWKNKQENLLSWNGEIPTKQLEAVRQQLQKERPDAFGAAETLRAELRKLSAEYRKQHPHGDFRRTKTYQEYADKIALANRINEVFDDKQHPRKGVELYDFLTFFLESDKEASMFLLRAGIDGIKYPAASGGGGNGSKGWNYVVFDENAVSIENHALFQIAGEQGAAALDAADLAEGREFVSRMDNLQTARDMEAAGKDAKAIRLATGWEKGADGKWRYEIEDIKKIDIKGNVEWLQRHPQVARYLELEKKESGKFLELNEGLTVSERKEFEELRENPEVQVFTESGRGTMKNPAALKLEDYIDAPELFAAYPQLREVRLNFAPAKGNSLGSYAPGKITLYGVDTEFFTGNNAEKTRSTLTHEIQHAIQDIEGFAAGGNIEQFTKYKKLDTIERHKSNLRAKGRELLHEINRLSDQILKDTGFNLNNERESYIARNGSSDGWNEYLDEKLGTHPLYKKGKQLREKYKKINEKAENVGKYKLPSGKWVEPYMAYSALSGEVESRNAEARMNLSPEERRKQLLADTADVAPEDQIVLLNGASAAMRMEAREDDNFYLSAGRELNNLRKARGSGQAKAAAKEFLNRPITNQLTGMRASVSGESLSKMLSSAGRKGSFNVQAHMQAVANIDKLFAYAVEEMSRPGKKAHDAETIKAVHHFNAPMLFDGNVVQVRMLVKEFVRAESGSRIYLVNAVEVDEDSSPVIKGAATEQAVVGTPAPGYIEQYKRLSAFVKQTANIWNKNSSDLSSGALEERSPEIDRLFQEYMERMSPEQRARAARANGFTFDLADGRHIINLMQSGNLSTVLHEFSHIWLRTMEAALQRRELNAAGAEVLNKAARWMAQYQGLPEYRRNPDGTLALDANGNPIRSGGDGRIGGSRFTEYEHEAFARAFEQYLLEGKAPAPEMRGVFAAVRKFMMEIYRNLVLLVGENGERITITPYIRKVFAMMLWAEDNLSAAEEYYGGNTAVQPAGAENPETPDGEKRRLTANELLKLYTKNEKRQQVIKEQRAIAAKVLQDICEYTHESNATYEYSVDSFKAVL